MLFEIHDIILHRLWKRAKRKFKAYQAAASEHEAFTPGQWDKYTKLTDAVYAARRRYLNHQRRYTPNTVVHDDFWCTPGTSYTVTKIKAEHVQCG